MYQTLTHTDHVRSAELMSLSCSDIPFQRTAAPKPHGKFQHLSERFWPPFADLCRPGQVQLSPSQLVHCQSILAALTEGVPGGKASQVPPQLR